jgi:hypothetical protein
MKMNKIAKEFIQEYGVLEVENPRIEKEVQILDICEHTEEMTEYFFVYDKAEVTVTEQQIREYISANELSFSDISELINNLKYFDLDYEFEGTREVSGNIIIK